MATSATLGDVLWEKNTVDGILSAVGTRLVFSNTVTLRVERALDAQQLAAARYIYLFLFFSSCVVIRGGWGKPEEICRGKGLRCEDKLEKRRVSKG